MLQLSSSRRPRRNVSFASCVGWQWYTLFRPEHPAQVRSIPLVVHMTRPKPCSALGCYRLFLPCCISFCLQRLYRFLSFLLRIHILLTDIIDLVILCTGISIRFPLLPGMVTVRTWEVLISSAFSRQHKRVSILTWDFFTDGMRYSSEMIW